ncbi:hypothetical protein GCM10025331_80130 [Actinoplanes utahensis]|nr:hypothetical protein Aut01nite_68910 [Actinoplanes utahensis]
MSPFESAACQRGTLGRDPVESTHSDTAFMGLTSSGSVTAPAGYRAGNLENKMCSSAKPSFGLDLSCGLPHDL